MRITEQRPLELSTPSRVDPVAELAESIAARRGSPVHALARLRLTMASVLLLEGRPAEAVQDADALLAEPGISDNLRAAGELARLIALLADDDLTPAGGAATSMLDSPSASAELDQAAALCTLAFVAWNDGRLSDALAQLRCAVRAADRCPTHGLLVYPRLALAPMLTAMGETDEADRLARAGDDDVELDGAVMWAALPAVVQARLHLAAGRTADAESAAETAVSAIDSGSAGYFTPLAVLTQAEVRLLRGELAEAARHIARAREMAPPWAGFGSETLPWVAARVAEAEGDPRRAVQIMSEVYADPHAHQRLFLDEPAAAPWLVRLALDNDHRAYAEDIVNCVEHLADSNAAFTTVTAVAIHARALLDDDAEKMAGAAFQHRHRGAQAAAWEDAGSAYARHDDHARAQANLSCALDAFADSGADRDCARVRSRLRDIGVRSCHWRRSDRPVDGWDSLTDTERAVVELVSEGLTNRQAGARMFLSHHTVAFHLRQIFRKLGVSSRGELIRARLEHAS
jgi:ATP/maltotriose-dependent transcriptional regulator MalT